jgi:predicted RNA-binding Zn-ribbon protein involved in translation (DUF1610 family)
MESSWKVPAEIKCSACENVLNLSGQTAFASTLCPQCGSETIVPAALGTFLLLGQIGGSDTGGVYQAFDTEVGRQMAIKILRPEWIAHPQWFSNLDREAKAAAALNHPNIAAVYGVGEVEGKAYLAMELLSGGSLADRVRQSGKLPETEVIEIAIKTASALRAAHQRGVLHRDIRPGNILFDSAGTPKLVEFGLSRPPAMEDAGREYQAPEKIHGQPDDVFSDIYSLGSTLMFALDGRPPAMSASAHAPFASEKRLGLGPSPGGARHSGARQVLSRMHAWNTADRYSTWDDVIRDLQQSRRQGGEAIPHKLPVPAAIGAPPPKPKLPVGAIVAVLALVGVATAGVMYRNEVMRFLERGELIDQEPAQRATAVTAPLVDLNGTEAWEKSWARANDYFSNRQFQEAVSSYVDAMEALGNDRPVEKRWLQFFQALALMADERYQDARVFLERLEPPVSTTLGVPASVTVTNFSETLLQGLLGITPTAQLRAAAGKTPVWAGGLATLVCAYKQLEQGNYAEAALDFNTYGGLTGTQSFAWAFPFRALAQRQGRDCDNAARLFARMQELEQRNALAEAEADIRSLAAKIKIKAVQQKLQLVADQLPAAAPPPMDEPMDNPPAVDPVEAEAKALIERDRAAREKYEKQQEEDAATVKE